MALANSGFKLRKLHQRPLIVQGTLEPLTRLTRLPVLDITQTTVISSEMSKCMAVAGLLKKEVFERSSNL